MSYSSHVISFDFWESYRIPAAAPGHSIEFMLGAARCKATARLPSAFTFYFNPSRRPVNRVDLLEARIDDAITLAELRQGISTAGFTPADLLTTLVFLREQSVCKRRWPPLLGLDHGKDPDLLLQFRPASDRIEVSALDLSDGLWGRYLFLVHAK